MIFNQDEIEWSYEINSCWIEVTAMASFKNKKKMKALYGNQTPDLLITIFIHLSIDKMFYGTSLFVYTFI
jgi:hypothetical protein